MRKACVAWCEHHKRPLPSPDKLEQIVTTRDFGDLEIFDDDSNAVKAAKEKDLEAGHLLFDFYVDTLLVAAAGVKVWHTGVRHKEPVSTCKQATSHRPRITAATEAICLMLYRNSHKRWNLQIEFRKTNKKGKFPKWTPKKPDENKDWIAPYCTSNGGTCRFGGWSEEGRKMFARLQIEINNNRLAHKERFAKEEKACCLRLQKANPDLHGATLAVAPKKRKAVQLEEEDDEDFDFILEM